jgi:uncharacterized protein
MRRRRSSTSKRAGALAFAIGFARCAFATTRILSQDRLWAGRGYAGAAMPLWSYPLLVAVGFAASVLNVVGGGGSFFTLPVLIFLGLPSAEANGTNRLGIITQSAGAVLGFHRHRLLDWPWAVATALPSSLGALAGVWLALRLGDREFRRILAVTMVAITVWSLLRPPRKQTAGRRLSPWSPAILLGFLVAGFYGGFVQAGVGFLLIAITRMAGIDLVHGNAIKVFTVLVLTAVALSIFTAVGRVHWPAAVALAAGSLAGAHLGVRLTIAMGHRLLEVAAGGTAIVFAVLLWIN